MFSRNNVAEKSESESQNEENENEFLTKEAEMFRAKLVTDFHLLEHFAKGGNLREIPSFYTSDITNKVTFHTILKTNTDGLVRFRPVMNVENVAEIDRRKNRVKSKNSKRIPLDIVAHNITTSLIFQNLVLLVILVNCVVLGIEAELGDRNTAGRDEVLLAITIFDYFSLFVFVLEILIKWTDQFWLFWKNNWNIFDFFVTFATLIPEIILLGNWLFYDKDDTNFSSFTHEITIFAKNLRTFRVLRSLKVVSRFASIRIIILAVTMAVQAMVFIALLLFIFAYIFAVMGVVIFSDAYKEAPEGSLNQADSFTTLWNAFVTLFQLFTMDGWFGIYQDATSIANYFIAAVYVMLWILIGSFVFTNLFVGIMVNNFQSIRTDLHEHMEAAKKVEEREENMVLFAEELKNQSTSNRKEGADTKTEDVEKENLKGASEADIQLLKSEKDATEWQAIVEKNLENIAMDDTPFYWPKDSLFQYFLTMENIVENLSEREELLSLLAQSMLEMIDD